MSNFDLNKRSSGRHGQIELHRVARSALSAAAPHPLSASLRSAPLPHFVRERTGASLAPVLYPFRGRGAERSEAERGKGQASGAEGCIGGKASPPLNHPLLNPSSTMPLP